MTFCGVLKISLVSRAVFLMLFVNKCCLTFFSFLGLLFLAFIGSSHPSLVYEAPLFTNDENFESWPSLSAIIGSRSVSVGLIWAQLYHGQDCTPTSVPCIVPLSESFCVLWYDKSRIQSCRPLWKSVKCLIAVEQWRGWWRWYSFSVSEWILILNEFVGLHFCCKNFNCVSEEVYLIPQRNPWGYKAAKITSCLNHQGCSVNCNDIRNTIVMNGQGVVSNILYWKSAIRSV